MGKPFENITEASFDLLQEILEHPNSTPADLFFDDPTVDGQIEILLNSNLVSLNSDDQVSITELGRAALKQRDHDIEQRNISQKQHNDELEAFKSIADSMSKQLDLALEQARIAKKSSRFAKVTSILALIISIIAIIAPAIYSLLGL